ncbi:hypothetical protein ABZW18_33755 [Streptomyces sp. NPDC004647]|uniref:hypothetical protein n=1 Tax=Streptomyces sp. NPDC004647 TaxID=3154671 RepID=UPI0033B43DEF
MPLTAREAVAAAAGFAYDTALKFELLARQWEADGNAQDADLLRAQGRNIVLALAEYAAVNGPEVAYKAVEESARRIGVDLPWPRV